MRIRTIVKTICYGLGGAMFLFALSAFTGGTLHLPGTYLVSLVMGMIGGGAGILIATRRRPQLTG